MRNSIIHKGIILPLGIFLVILGSWRIVGPISFYAFSGLTLEPDTSLLNEARGVGGLIFASGFVVVSGAFFPSMAFTSTLISVLVFWSFAGARLYGIFVDGMPNGMILQGLFFEILFGSLGAFAMIKYRIVAK